MAIVSRIEHLNQRRNDFTSWRCRQYQALILRAAVCEDVVHSKLVLVDRHGFTSVIVLRDQRRVFFGIDVSSASAKAYTRNPAR